MLFYIMMHRHLNHTRYTLAAVDDVISRGGTDDWIELNDAMQSDSEVHKRVAFICERHRSDLTAQRYQFWLHRAN